MKTRIETVEEIRHLFGPDETLEHLIDWLEDAWETHDLLIKLFGKEHAHQIFNASASSCVSSSLTSFSEYDRLSEQYDEYVLN